MIIIYKLTPQFAVNSSVDFAVWLLTRTGVSISPFDKHQQSNNPPFSSQQWLLWLDRMLRQQDSRLCMRSYEELIARKELTDLEIKQKATQEIEQSKVDCIKMGIEPSTIGNWEELYQQKIQFIKDEQAYEAQAIHDASIEWGDEVKDIPTFGLLPHELWEDRNFVSQLEQFWMEYQQTKSETATLVSDKILPPIDLSANNKYLCIYLVNYSHDVIFMRNSSTLLVGISDSTMSKQELFDLVRKAGFN